MTIVCPYQDCQQHLAIEPQHAGAEANCPTCRRPMQLPELSAFPPEEIDPAPWATEDPAPESPIGQEPARAASSPARAHNPPSPASTRGPAPEDPVANLISRAPSSPAPPRREPQPQHPVSRDSTPASHASRHGAPPRDGRDAMPPSSDPGADPRRTPASKQENKQEKAPEQPLTPGGAAGCPKCMHAFGETEQEFVRELVELREIGADVRKMTVRCPCGATTAFENILWIRNTADAEPHPDHHGRGKRPVYHPPNSSRDRAKILSDAGFTAVKKGDMDSAHTRWLQATQADQSWSVPFFNLARLSLDRGDRHSAIAFLGIAEERAQRGSSVDDAQVIKQVPFLKSRLEVNG